MRKTKQRLPLVTERKAFVATEDRNELSAHRDHALEINLRNSPGDRTSSWHCLALIDSV
jgi:hypothetical protein